MKRFGGLTLGLAAVLLTWGCANIPVTPSDVVLSQRGVEVSLRSERDVAYEHPVEIDARRMVQVLGALRVQVPKQRETMRAIHLDIMPEVAKGVAQALAQAKPGEVVAVSAIRKVRRIGILDDKFLTTFLVYEKSDRLYVDLSRIEWKVPKGFAQDKLPVPRHGLNSMHFELETVPPLIESPAHQIAAIRWQDAVFSVTPAASPLPTANDD